MYKVTSRIMDGINVIGYIIENEFGQTKNVKRQAFIELCLENAIINCKASKNGNEYNLSGIGCKLVDLPSTNMHNIKDEIKTIEASNETCKRMHQFSEYVILLNRLIYSDSGELGHDKDGNVRLVGKTVGYTIQNTSEYRLIDKTCHLKIEPHQKIVLDLNEALKLMTRDVFLFQVSNANMIVISSRDHNAPYRFKCNRRFQDGTLPEYVQIGEKIYNTWHVKSEYKPKFMWIEQGEIRDGRLYNMQLTPEEKQYADARKRANCGIKNSHDLVANYVDRLIKDAGI